MQVNNLSTSNELPHQDIFSRRLVFPEPDDDSSINNSVKSTLSQQLIQDNNDGNLCFLNYQLPISSVARGVPLVHVPIRNQMNVENNIFAQIFFKFPKIPHYDFHQK